MEDVVIVGAGPVGLSLALGLAQHGVRSVLLEREPHDEAFTRAFAVHMRTLEIFKDWGLFERFRERGHMFQQLAVWVPGQEQPAATVDFSPLAEDTFAPGVLLMPQDRIQSLLLEAVRERGLTDVRLGHEVTGFSVTDGRVRVEVQADRSYSIEARCLAGCDGAHSRVRETLGLELMGKTYPTRILLVDLRFTGEMDRMELPWPRVAAQESGFLAGLRMDEERFRMIATAKPGRTDEELMASENVHALVERLFGAGPIEILWSAVAQIHCRTSPRFRSGPVLLCGDAAHVNSPAGGQGMNSGIHDAHNLAWKLARAMRGGDEDALLRSYDEERRAAVLNDVDRYTDLLTRIGITAPGWVRALLGAAAPTLLAQPWVLRMVGRRLGMLNTQYPNSTLLVGTEPSLGTRVDAPLLRGGEQIRLLDLAGPRAVLLLLDSGGLPRWDVAGVTQSLAAVDGVDVFRVVPAKVPPEERDLVDIHDRLWPGGRGRRAVLIRPDGHVGWVADGPTADEMHLGLKRAIGDLPNLAWPAQKG